MIMTMTSDTFSHTPRVEVITSVQRQRLSGGLPVLPVSAGEFGHSTTISRYQATALISLAERDQKSDTPLNS
ncbi:hypothetical protein [Mesorhizobium sp. WSM2239]|uniref:Uncharacterized protein n=2 Tax=unclassified Mesorhizobium TaxID=325217 RepID=A0AAU8DHM3_9HYPH